MKQEIKKGDKIYVNSLTEGFVSVALSEPFETTGALSPKPYEAVLVKTSDNKQWAAPLYLCSKLT